MAFDEHPLPSLALPLIGPGHLSARDVRIMQEVLWRTDEGTGPGLPTISWYVADDDPEFEWGTCDYEAYERALERALQRLISFGLVTSPWDGEYLVTEAGFDLLGRC